MDKKETLITGLVFVFVFAAAFSFAAWWNTQNTYLFGFKVISQKPVGPALREVFAGNESLILRQELTQEASQENSGVIGLSAEIVFAAKVTGKDVHVYGIVNSVPVNGSCNANNSFCGEPDIVVVADNSDSPCNCLFIRSNNLLEFRGSPSFLLENAPNARRLVYAARAPEEE
ncbi:hypothetical protein HY571_00270 [Candidatus Micrarchaeota archaeon]|nr:hypothetical protein [Candidatus Micrarchaeota archaeon]